MKELESAKKTIDKDKLKYISEIISKDYKKIGQGFEYFSEFNILLRAMTFLKRKKYICSTTC